MTADLAVAGSSRRPGRLYQIAFCTTRNYSSVHMATRCLILNYILSSHNSSPSPSFFFFFNDTSTTEIYTLSLHDALPISRLSRRLLGFHEHRLGGVHGCRHHGGRSEEHTSELQSHSDLVCRLLLEKKKT